MNRIFIFIAIAFIFSCKKHNNNTSATNSVKQFHKSIAIGETYAQNPEILHASKGTDEEINIVYPEADQLKWIQFSSNKVFFKKQLQPTGNFKGFWSKGFIKNKNDNFVIVGTYWQYENSLGSMYISTADKRGNLLGTKVISLKSGENIRGDIIYPARDGGYFVASTANHSFDITKITENAEVKWRRNGLFISQVTDISGIKSLAEDSKGNIYVATLQNVYGSGFSPQECIIKLSPDGNIIWIKSLEIRNMDGHNNSDYNIKYLIVDENDVLYAFEEFHYVGRIMMTKFDTDGNILALKNFGSGIIGLYDVQYIDQDFYLLTGGANPVKTLNLKMNQNFEITKKGIVLAVGDLPWLPGKFFKSPSDQSTDYLLAGKDEQDNNAWQYIRLDEAWKYPCYNYSMQEVNLKDHLDFSIKTWDTTQFETATYSTEDFITADAVFELKNYTTSNMVTGVFCEQKNN